MTSSRFDYVKYDETAVLLQNHFKSAVMEIENDISGIGVNVANRSDDVETLARIGRAKSMAVEKLEELYMWIGKAIRDEQIARNGSAPLQEERTNS